MRNRVVYGREKGDPKGQAMHGSLFRLIGNRWVEPITVNNRPVDVRCQSCDFADLPQVNPEA